MSIFEASNGDYVQLGVGCIGEVESRSGSQFGLLRTVGG
jgi:hypothetical protein